MATVEKRGHCTEPQKKEAPPAGPRFRFTKYLVALETVALLASPFPLSFINNKGGNPAMAQKTVATQKPDVSQKVDEALKSILAYIRTGDAAELEAFESATKSLKPGKGEEPGESAWFSYQFGKAIDAQAAKDPGVKGFLDAYTAKKGSPDAEKLVAVLTELYGSTREDAEKKYGADVCDKFASLISWRLAAYASNTAIDAFSAGNLEDAAEELARVAAINILGTPTEKTEAFMVNFDALLAKKLTPEQVALWDAYEGYCEGKKTPMMKELLREIGDCAKMISDSGTGPAEKKYGKDFVSEVLAFTKLMPVATKTTGLPAEELVSMLKDGRTAEFLFHAGLSAAPIGEKKEVSERIKAFQMLFNELVEGDESFRSYLKKEKQKTLLKGVKEDGDYANARSAITALSAYLAGVAGNPETAPAFKAALVDMETDVTAIKKGTVLSEAALKGLIFCLGIKPQALKAVPLEEQVKGLSSAERDFYNTNLKSWLEEKTSEEEGYKVVSLKGLIGDLTSQVAAKKLKLPVDQKWLDAQQQLKTFKMKNYLQGKEAEYKPSEVTNAIMKGEGIGDALKTLVIGKDAVSTKTAAAGDFWRVRTTELLLDTFIASTDLLLSEDEFAPYVEKLGKVTITLDGKYEMAKEGEAVKAVQELLFNHATKSDRFNEALKLIGIDYLADLKPSGVFDEKTAKALAAFIAIFRGTWDSEKQPLLKGAKPAPSEDVVLPFFSKKK
ncbi:hypothetical protein H0O02_01125 [Candidatus Micrarchaeota archaeon]|nr:hypothetical protein [Candidatus Micrarchaeota archaeon]